MSDSVKVEQATNAASNGNAEAERDTNCEGSEIENETLQLAIKLSNAKIAEKEADKAKQDDVEEAKMNKTCVVSTSNVYANIEASFSLDNLVKVLEETLAAGHYKEESIFNKVQFCMENYDASLGDYEKYALRADNKRYTRNLIKKSPYFTLMLLVWPPNIASPIHDHGGSECWLRVIAGSLEERFYEKPEKQKAIKLRFSEVHESPAVCFINDEQGLHSICNPLDDTWSISLHCYVPGYESCNAYFDETNASKGKKECRLTFTSINGIKLKE